MGTFAKACALILTSMIATTAASGAPGKQSSVEVTAKTLPDQQIRIEFRAVPAKGLKINTEGPWSLELKKHDGLEIPKKKWTREDFQESIPGFAMTSKAKSKSGQIDFKMVVFVCTENKSQCFREVQNGQFDWGAH